MINFLDDNLFGIDSASGSCAGSKIFPILETTKFIIRIVQIAVPFALVIWGSLDWFKALIAHDEKEMRIKRKPFIQRVIAAIIIIVLPVLMEFICKVVTDKSTTANFFTCYHEAKPRIDFTKAREDIENEDNDDCYPFCGSGPEPRGTRPTQNDDINDDFPTGTACEDYKNVTADVCEQHNCDKVLVSPRSGDSSERYNCVEDTGYGKGCYKYSNMPISEKFAESMCEKNGCVWCLVANGGYCDTKASADSNPSCKRREPDWYTNR